MSYLVTVSIVSHKQFALVKNLLSDLKKFCDPSYLEVIITLNVREAQNIASEDYPFHLVIVQNESVKGFGANHNKAFSIAKGSYFCVLNPDMRFNCDPFRTLCQWCSDKSVGVIAPLVIGGAGNFTDSARRFPTVFSLLYRGLLRSRKAEYFIDKKPIQPDWIAGMFLLFPSSVFRKISGFDERYFLYFEDVDICARLFLKGFKVVLDPRVNIFHLEQRTSHREPSYLYHHVASMIRFFLSPVYWRVISVRFGIFESQSETI